MKNEQKIKENQRKSEKIKEDEEKIKRIKKIVELIQRKSNSKIIIFNFPQLFLDFNHFSDQSISTSFSSIINYLNIKLDETFSNKVNCYIYDFSKFISKFG